MAVLLGACAYRTVSANAESMNKRQPDLALGRDVRLTGVLCPKCGESYTLVQEANVSRDIFEDDVRFLTKVLSAGHPCHPSYIIVRDPDSYLYQQVREDTSFVTAQLK